MQQHAVNACVKRTSQRSFAILQHVCKNIMCDVGHNVNIIFPGPCARENYIIVNFTL